MLIEIERGIREERLYLPKEKWTDLVGRLTSAKSMSAYVKKAAEIIETDYSGFSPEDKMALLIRSFFNSSEYTHIFDSDSTKTQKGKGIRGLEEIGEILGMEIPHDVSLYIRYGEENLDAVLPEFIDKVDQAMGISYSDVEIIHNKKKLSEKKLDKRRSHKRLKQKTSVTA